MYLLRYLFPLAVIAADLGAQRPAPSTPIPMNASVRTGRLANGFRYYVQRNTRPQQRVELRLIVNAGSIQEDEDQRGLAHFLEHMLFNGTQRFRKNDIGSYLESIGVRFGADLNAQTGFDETIYILPVPTDKPGLLERSFDILEDWARAALIDSTEVVAERGVVLEEWRSGLGADSRIRDAQFPVIFKGSKYAERIPIGLPEVLRGATPEPIRRFYRDWYRPDLMALVAVGDIDPVRVERLIRQRFSALRNPPRPRPRAGERVPGNREPLVTIATDPEEQVTTVGVLYKHAPQAMRTAADYRRSLIEELYHTMFNARLGELARKEDTPFSVAGSSYGAFVRESDAYQLVAVAKEGKTMAAFEAVLTEARRVREHGFLAAELERAKADLRRAYESAYAERATTESSSFAQEYIAHFLTGEPSPGIAWEWRTVQRVLPGIGLAEINALGKRWITDENRVVTLSAPAREGQPLPTSAELLAVFPRVAGTTVAAWTENVAEGAIVPMPPTPGRVVTETTVAALGVTDWRLSNGIRVLLKPTDFKKDEVLLRGFSPGGLSLVSDADVPSGSVALTAVERGGVGEFDAIALGKKLAGIQASASPFIEDAWEGVTGAASPKDLGTLFQLAYARLTMPRRDSTAFAAFLAQVAPFLANRATNPEAVFGDTITVTLAQHSPRAQPISPAYLQQISFGRAFDIYRDRFSDFGDYTFVVVGSFSLDSVKPLVERWLGGLPSTGRRESWRDAGVRPPAGAVTRVVRKGVEPKAQTVVVHHGPATFSPTERHALRSVTEYLEMKLLEQLREALGGTYSVGVNGSLNRVPQPRFSASIQFGSAPERADSLYAVVQSVIDSAKSGTITEADVAKIREQQVRALEVSLRENGYWLTNLAARVENGEDPAGLLAYRTLIDGLTAARLRDAAQRYFSGANVARFTLLPESPPPRPQPSDLAKPSGS
jgi:zinc protease